MVSNVWFQINNTIVFSILQTIFVSTLLQMCFQFCFIILFQNCIKIGNPEMSGNLRNEWQIKTLKLLLLDLDQKNNKV